ncbi:BglG family transcription antiterminator [Agromyces agglutinans]|uniref:BglG family transcription antiterminator n=1 Tax=Agromyces agglutinans TaxID=2662258 RepID=UPI001561FA42|nr:PTS sugar transporter subunit IIA [Agromyces agglutinans]
MAEQWQRLLDELARADGWTTASELAGRLGVTTRTVRSWVARANADGPLVRSGPGGYRVDLAQLADPDRSVGADSAPADRPERRAVRIIRLLVDDLDAERGDDDGFDLHELAARVHVSESTLEADLARVRARLEGTPLSIERRGPTIRLVGPEAAKRRMLGDLLREETARGRIAVDALRRRLPELGAFRAALIEGLAEAGYAPNEYALDDVLLHIAIAADRVRRDRTIGDAARASGSDALEALLAGLVESHLQVRLPPADAAHLARLLRTRAATLRPDAIEADHLRSPRTALVREIVRRAASEYLVDLDDDDIVERLALHVDNLAARSADRSFSRNPLTAQIKAAYPLIYELGVYVASELAREEGITVNDDEIAYLAMHLGAHLDRRRPDADRVRIAIVAPEYHDLGTALRARIEHAVGDWATVAASGDGDIATADLVVAVVPPSSSVHRLVLVSPLPTDTEIERVRGEVLRLRRARRTARLAARLAETIEPGFFVRGLRGQDREGIIRMLGARLVEGGVIDRAYVEGAVERERMSSTAFADHIAVPHAMSMSAARTAIAIGVDEVAVDWAGTPVHLVALIAFADSGRAEFQELFDQFVETFSERENVLRLVRGAQDHAGLVAELARLMQAADLE